MAYSNEITAMQAYAEELRNNPVKLRAFMRSVMGPSKRLLEDHEREHMITVFRLLEPMGTNNNQRSFTEEYEHAGKKYDVTYFEDEVIVEEILKDDI